MKQLLYNLLCLMLAVFLLAGCDKTAEPSTSGIDSPSAEGTIHPTEHPPEASAKDPFTGNDVSAAPKESEAVIPEQQPEGTTMTAIQIIVGENTFTAELYDNAAAQTLAEMLPLTLDMSELNGNEKYYYLGESLPRESSIPSEIRTGDLMLYGADCLVLFYKDFTTTYSYTPLGRISDPEGLAAALGSGNVQVTFQS